LMVAALAGARSVAFYSLAGSIATVVALPGTALGAALFPRMTKLSAIPREWLLITWGAALAGSVGAATLGQPLVTTLFSSRYRSAADLLIPLAMAEGLRSVTALYISFQSAHGRGRELRKAATYFTASNLIFNLGLIPAFGAAGAAWASFLALLVNLVAHMTYYRRALPAPVIS
ncbi:MAG: polysaccharide biosynthesis C-terminal domain-containing protein, partial [Actinobacteria bacterium]|nr:polysaccharide biosynthesis C-terminal domain-containing protein [Actinomycetota bacterium]